MLRYAVKYASRDGIHNLLLVHADATVLPVASESLDAAICCGALHLFPEPAASLASIFGSLKPGRRVVLAVFRRSETRASEFYSRLRQRLYGIVSFSSSELESMLVDAGFCDVQVHHAKGIWLIVSAKKSM
jgi:ubiquinone/menaquinone biosynthesis C-methylase UbiE